jgi:flagellum-specific peptidoglycan hydrolase FlgJ
MKVNKKLIIPVVVLTLAAGSGATALAATDAASTNTNKQDLAQEIANKFHLNSSDVQAVIDQHHSEKQQDRETKYENMLTKAVTDGKLTDAQKQAVLTEHNKLVSELKSTAQGDRKQTLKTVRQEAKDWASQNGVDAKWVLPLRGMAQDSNAAS